MRSFKFRAWHAGNERKTGGFYKGHEPKMLYDIKAGDSLRWLAEGQNITDVMQSTGILDKNGVEVYEGDVVRNWQGGWNVVVYKAPAFEATVAADQSCSYSMEWWSSVEVIGNVHEHPQLLNP